MWKDKLLENLEGDLIENVKSMGLEEDELSRQVSHGSFGTLSCLLN